MHNFRSKHNRKLMMDLENQGISFHYATAQGVYQSGRSWASIHALLMKLHKCQRFTDNDHSLSAWIQDEELCLRFRAPEWRWQEECRFSPAETAKIMDLLGKAPNFN